MSRSSAAHTLRHCWRTARRPFLTLPPERPDHLVPDMRKVRFRTLGCYPLTGAIKSEADTLEAIIAEMLVATTSERQGRVIDKDAGGAGMEKKKQEGYF